jgi:UDP-N-acetylglucosamine 4-epimerase
VSVSRYQDTCEALRVAPRRWLVTGAAGFIGSALVEELLALGQTVVGVDNFATGHRRNLEDVLRGAPAGSERRFEFVEGDICDPALCRLVTTGVDAVLHQAALGSVPRSLEDPLASHRANVDGFLTLVLAARDSGVKRVVYASSSSVYGDSPELPKVEERTGRVLSPYAATKAIDELYAGVVQRCYGLELTGLRYFNVFGRRQDPDGPYAAVIPRWIGALLAGQECRIFGDGQTSRDFCYVDNAVQANLLAATAPASTTGAIYNVACGQRTTLLELFGLLRDLLSRHRPDIAAMRPAHAPPRPGDIAHSLASIARIRDQLGYEPSHDIATGLARTVPWFVEHRR